MGPHFSCRLVWERASRHQPCPVHLCCHLGRGSLLTSHQPGAALHPRPPCSPQVCPEGRAASETRPAGLRTHLTMPAFSPEMAAFRYCFHAVALSFMFPMNAFPLAVLQGGGSPQGRCPSLNTQGLRTEGALSPDLEKALSRWALTGGHLLLASLCPQSCSEAPWQ